MAPRKLDGVTDIVGLGAAHHKYRPPLGSGVPEEDAARDIVIRVGRQEQPTLQACPKLRHRIGVDAAVSA
jgi:hypothetical protein